jgi:hypothetical protein
VFLFKGVDAVSMRLRKERIQQIANKLAEHLFSEEMLSTAISKDQLSTKIEQIITDELAIEDDLNDEVRELLKAYESQIEKGQVDYHKMFSMVKRQLAKERGIIL